MGPRSLIMVQAHKIQRETEGLAALHIACYDLVQAPPCLAQDSPYKFLPQRFRVLEKW